MSGPQLREARQALGLTQAELARLLDVTQHRVSEYETGKVGVSRTVAAHVQTLLRVS